MYGASVKQVQDILKINDNFDIIPEENTDGMTMMLSEYAKSHYGNPKSGKKTPSRRGSTMNSPFKRNKLGTLGFGMAVKVKIKFGIRSESRSNPNAGGSISSMQRSYINSPLMSPKNMSKTGQKKSRFAPGGGNIFIDPSPAVKGKNGRVMLKDIKNKSSTLEFGLKQPDVDKKSSGSNALPEETKRSKISDFKIMLNQKKINLNGPKETKTQLNSKRPSKTDFKVRIPSRQSSMKTKDSYDVTDLEFKDMDLNSLRFLEIDLLEPENNNEIYNNIWAMFNVSQVADNYQISSHQFLKFIIETDNYYSR
jgi:hypothetical protein